MQIISSAHVGRFFPLITAAAMTWLQWPKWGDLLIDFGQVPYFAWRIASGDHIIRDFNFYYGVIPPYLDAFGFLIINKGIHGIFIFNFIILCLIILVIFEIVRHLAGVIVATVSSLTFVLIFAFGSFVRLDNYNYLAPYTTAATYGILFAFLMVYFLVLHHKTLSTWTLKVSALLLGIIFITKAEIFVAAAAAFVCTLVITRGPRPAFARAIASSLLLFLIPAFLVFLLLSTSLSYEEAFLAAINGWQYVFDSDLQASLQISRLYGGDNLSSNLLEMVCWLLGFVAMAGLAIVVDLKWKTDKALYLAGLVVGTFGVVVLFNVLTLMNFARILPLVCVGGLCLTLLPATNRFRLDRENLPLFVFGSVMFIRVFFNARFGHYGFFMAAAGWICLIIVALVWLPRLAKQHGGRGRAAFAIMTTFFFTFAFEMMNFSYQIRETKVESVGTGDNRIFAFRNRVEGVANSLRLLEKETREGDTLVIFPQGSLINYLAGRKIPIRFQIVNPLTLRTEGEESFLEEFNQNPPTHILFYQFDASEHGARFFGKDYGVTLYNWIRANYQAVANYGAPPYQSNEFGLELLRKNSN